MRLLAADQRGNRDAPDLAVLVAACGIRFIRGTAGLDEAYCPGDELADRTALLISRLIDRAPAVAPAPPDVPPLG